MTYVGSWADLKYTVPADHREHEDRLAEKRATGFYDPITRRPAEFRALHGRGDVERSFWLDAR